LPPKVSIVVLNWNGRSDTLECLASLEHLEYANYQVIVIDNGSSDDSVFHIRQRHPHVELLETGRNLGFSAGCNVGIYRSLEQGADYVWLLNNDTTADPGALTSLVGTAIADARTGATGSAIYSARRPHQLDAWGGGRINFWLGRSRHALRPVPDEAIDFLTGASILISRTVLERMGLLDEGFFMYWEDADYCYRLRRAGFRIAVAGESRIWHKGSASVGKASPQMDTYFNASAARFFRRHARLPQISLWTGVLLRLAKRLLAGKWDHARAVWTGVTSQNLPDERAFQSAGSEFRFVAPYKSAPPE
jgi:GT2 family glycosyltransferase